MTAIAESEQKAHLLSPTMPERARVTLEFSLEELKQLFTLAAQAGMSDLAYSIGRSGSALQANLNRLQNEWKDAKEAREAANNGKK